MLKSLPGCNAVTSGPNRASPAPASCPQNPTPSGTPARTDFVDVTATKKWFYVGCGTDSVGDRALTGPNKATDSMTVEKCIDVCSAGNQTFAALEYGRECYCGNTLAPKYAPRQGYLGNCLMKCVGNKNQVCGDAARISVYRKCTGSTCRNRDYNDAAVLRRRGEETRSRVLMAERRESEVQRRRSGRRRNMQ